MTASRQNTGAARTGAAPGKPDNGETKSIALPDQRAANSPAVVAGIVQTTAAKREVIFDRLSRMFRRAGNDVTAQALFRAVLEYRVEALEKDK
jgi:hypothetical protein